MFKFVAAAAAAASLLAPSSAAAVDPLKVADRYWGPHDCSGRVQVIETADISPSLDGFASGMTPHYDPATGVWQHRVERCEVTIRKGLDETYRCHVLVHEVGHLWQRTVHDHDAHTGRMSPESLANFTGCEPPPREQLIDGIRESLPQGVWRISCTPNSRRMRCRATSPTARYVRRWTASIHNGQAVAYESKWTGSRPPKRSTRGR